MIDAMRFSTYLTQLTESWCAFFTAFVWRLVIGSNNTIDFFSHAAINSELKMEIDLSQIRNRLNEIGTYKPKKGKKNHNLLTHLVNILSYRRHHIRSQCLNYYSIDCTIPNVCKWICVFDFHSQHYVLILAPVYCIVKIYPFQYTEINLLISWSKLLQLPVFSWIGFVWFP